jgi:hypothetical protein
MHRFFARAFLGGIGSVAWLASCQTLPPTKPLVSAGTAGDSAGGTAGGGTGGSGGSSGNGTGGSSTGGSAGATGGTAQGGTSGNGDGGADDGGADSGGTGGVSGSGGSSGKGGSAGKAGSGGAGTGGMAGRTYSTDPETFFGESRCTSDLDFCEDFENASLNTDRWSPQGLAPTVETVRAARGMRAAHFHTEGNGLSLLHTTEPFPATNNRYYGRLFVWLDSVPTAPDWALWAFAASRTEADESEIRVGGQYDTSINRFGISTNYGPTGDWSRLDEDPGDPVPVRTWVCVEWLHDGQNDVTDLWWNGVPRPSLHTTATEHGGMSGEYRLPDIDSMFIGFWVFHAMPEPDHYDAWIDEVAIDSERIGCNN